MDEVFPGFSVLMNICILQASDLAASYAALILADEGIEITVRTQDSPPAGA